MSEKLTLGEALSAYRSLIKSSLPQPYSRDANAYDYRTGSMGRESADPAYRSAIFYVKLSKAINPTILYNFLKKTEYYLLDGRNSRGKYHMLFLNRVDGTLIHPKGHCVGRSNALRATRDYFDRYMDSESVHAGRLTEVFPPTDLYADSKCPTKDDLSVLVVDEDGAAVDDSVKAAFVNRPNKLVVIRFLPDSLFEVERILTPDDIPSIQKFDDVAETGEEATENADAQEPVNGFELELFKQTYTSFGYISPVRVRFAIDINGNALCRRLERCVGSDDDEDDRDELEEAVLYYHRTMAELYPSKASRIPGKWMKLSDDLAQKIKKVIRFLLSDSAINDLEEECKNYCSTAPTRVEIILYEDSEPLKCFNNDCAAMDPIRKDNKLCSIFNLIDEAEKEFQ